jgi:polysaccharide deacetylase family protein (PEP-CTERM system associated)
MQHSSKIVGERFILLTIDVEDWFQVENFKKYITFSAWKSHESRVESNTLRLLDFFDQCSADLKINHIQVTFFVLGWIAERFPHLIREIRSRGHEVASHGYNHNLCTMSSEQELRKDLMDSKKLLEDVLGAPIFGYRAPSFSINENVLSILRECNYFYDSSYNNFEMNHRYGALPLPKPTLGNAYQLSDRFFELPISNFRAWGKVVVPSGGGGYFRLFPGHFFKFLVRGVLREQNAYLFYMHPWEIDAEQPRVRAASMLSKFRHYLAINSTLPKLFDLISSFKNLKFVSCRQYLKKMGLGA